MSTIQNTNFLIRSQFRMDILRLPNVSFFTKSFTFPSIIGAQATVPTPFNNIPFAGDHATYTPLTVTCFMDENMTSYKELYSWWKGIYFPTSHDQYKTLVTTPGSKDKVYSDITLSILDYSKQTNNIMIFKDAFPTQLSGWEYSYDNKDASPITFEVSFSYQDFDFG